MIDDADRRAVILGAIRLVAFVVLILIGAAVAGGALRLFQIVSGV